MGYSLPMKSPDFPNVSSYQDRHGKWRWRYRKTGRPTYSFKSRYGSPSFHAEYSVAAGHKPRAKPQSLNALRGIDLVYIVGHRSGPVKIGTTNNIASRLVRLQTAHHQPLSLLAVIPGGKEVEADLHRRFAEQRRQGEWFDRSPELKALIRENQLTPWRTL